MFEFILLVILAYVCMKLVAAAYREGMLLQTLGMLVLMLAMLACIYANKKGAERRPLNPNLLLAR